MYYNRARWYDPKLGRFASEDPLGFAAGDPNLYRYVGNNPTNYTDPSGLEGEGGTTGQETPPGYIPFEPGEQPNGNTPPHALPYTPIPGSVSPGGYARGRLNPGNWWRWLYTGDPNASDYIYQQALEGTVAPLSRAIPQAQGVLDATSYFDKTGLTEGVNAFLDYSRGDDSSAWKRLAGTIAGKLINKFSSAFNRTLGAKAPARIIEQHHQLPTKFADKFRRAGLKIEDYKIPLEQGAHRLKPGGLHTVKGGNWNGQWKQFFDANRNPSPQQILDQLARMRKAFGLE